MSKRTFLTLVLALATAGSGSWAWLEHSRSERRETHALFEGKRLALVEAENDRLRGLVGRYEKTARDADEKARRADIEKLTAEIRGLPFKKPVDYDIVTREGIKEVLHQKFSDQYSDADFEAMRLGYVAMGFIPADFPLKQKYVDLLSEQIAAFYDQHLHKLFMFEDATLSNAQNRIILSHELTHALQDQHFNLAKLPLELKTNDDRALAASALVEGDATLQMQLFMLRDLSAKAIGQSIGGMFTQNMEQLAAAPRILRESLLFPYLKGLEFCMALQSGADQFGAISAAYDRLPASTTQILHPEKYFANEEPITVEWPDLAVLGEPPLFDNVMGEFATGVLLAEWVGEAATEAAEGWRGDRYLVYQKGNALVWRSIWSDAAKADRFASALRQMLAKRYNATPGSNAVDFTAKDRTIKLIRMIRSGGEKNATAEVILVDAREAKWADALAEKFSR